MTTWPKCRQCQHWKPLFTGEAWGVRSFADAPADAQAEIVTRLAHQKDRDGYADVQQALNGHIAADGTSYSSTPKVLSPTDWLRMGECVLTEEYGELPSLARAIDGSEYMAMLNTDADFGCVQWQAWDGQEASDA